MRTSLKVLCGLCILISLVMSLELFSALTCDEDEEYCIAWPEALLPNGFKMDGKPVEAPQDCVDRVEQCAYFLANGECKLNPGWMIVNCPVSCNSCHLRDSKVRCRRESLNISNSIAFSNPGSMENMFASLKKRLDNKFGAVNVLSTSPWVITVDDFVSNDEAHDLITGITTWERSTDAGEMNEFGESGRTLTYGRTSSNSWCRGSCERRPTIQGLAAKISQFIQVPVKNYEAFQVLRYEVGQQYVVHHDFSHHQLGLACGPRIMTVLLYLSHVEEGGETVFPELGITIKPKKGRAVFFPDVQVDDLNVADMRIVHRAKPVLKGQKYAVNTWVHLYDFKKPNLWGCTGLFDVL